MNKKVPFLFVLMVLGSISLFAFEVGDHVLVNWSGDDYWYFATIVIQDGGDYYVIYDDFTRAWVNGDDIVDDYLGSDDYVQARWNGGSVYYGGSILWREGDVVYILYDDGDEEVTTVSHLRILF